MEGRVRRNFAQVSPERCIVWTEPPRKLRTEGSQGTKVPVIYYLCKNNLLEQPHFIEVSISSPNGLYLRDVINRLVVLRGGHMPAMYSWSCKRSYRSGFVWQDLAENDLIKPAHGKNYILKGSLLQDQSSADALIPLNNLALEQKELSLNEELSSLSLATATGGIKALPLSNPTSPHLLRNKKSLLCSSGSTTVIGSPGECTIQIPSGSLDVSTQTEDRGGKKEQDSSTQTSCIPTDNEFPEINFNAIQPKDNQTSGESEEESSQIPMPWNVGMGTLISLIRAEVDRFDSFKEIQKVADLPKGKIKRTNALLQLISCGSILEKLKIT